MESPTLAAQSVCDEMSEFCRAELEAFVTTNQSRRPAAWARVQSLREACRHESPTTFAGLSTHTERRVEAAAA